MSSVFHSRRGLILTVVAAILVVGIASFVTAQQGVAIRTLRQPIGNPRVALPVDLNRLPRLLPPNIRLPGVCAAPVDVNIITPKVGLNMRTEDKAIWYSLVDTIPPVGHTASITVDPVNLLDGDRKVGRLLMGEVKFREVVRDVPLNGAEPENLDRVQALLSDFGAMSPDQLATLKPIPMPEYVVPGPGIQVMRAQLEERYEIDGIGNDTVQLHGWIAVRHGQARATTGEAEVTWENAVLDTEFVGMDLHGDSGVFGPVQVTLDTTRPSRGQVGRIQIPELAKVALLAKYKKDTVLADGAVVDAAATKGGAR